MDTAARETRDDDAELSRVLARDLRAVYQPIVALERDAVVGVEALARGPAESPLALPGPLFAAAAAAGRLAELDDRCRQAAVRGALDLPPELSLFINVEPDALAVDDGSLELLAEMAGERRIVLELTERALSRSPLELLATVRRARELGWRIALDDIGADPDSLALLPLLRPDVMKLDQQLVQGPITAPTARVVAAVSAESERTGGLVLAEGIEDDAHLERALAFGAQYGQGFRFGRPGPLAAALAGRRPLTALPGEPTPASPTASLTPFEIVERARPTRVSRKALLVEMSHQLEETALALGEGTVVLVTFQHARYFTPDVVRRYERLAASSTVVAVLGENLGPEPAPGVRGGTLDADDPLVGEWEMVVVGPDTAVVFAARDLGDDGPPLERRYDYALSYDRELALAVATALLERLVPANLAAQGRAIQARSA